jgi:Transcription factor WhiB
MEGTDVRTREKMENVIHATDGTLLLEPPAFSADQPLWAEITGQAGCADSALDPDEWFPVSPDAEIARRQAADAIAVCADCPVRPECLELSLRYWQIGQHGIWGGLVPAERAVLRQQLAHAPVPSRAALLPLSIR